MRRQHKSWKYTSRVLSFLFAFVVAISYTSNARSEDTTAKPNFVIIMADDLGYGDLSCYGNTRFKTPHLDRMAAEGLRFTDFHSSGNVCSPTRAGLMTGRYQQRAGIGGVINADPKVAAHHHGLYPEKEITLPELMKKAGYATAMFGKWHLGYTRPFNPVHHGFDRFIGYVSGNIDYISHYDRMGVYDWWNGLELIEEEGYCTHLITKHSVDYIKEMRDRPFCLYVAHEAVHTPLQGPDDPPIRGPHAVRGKVDGPRAFREMTVEMDRGVGDIIRALKETGLERKTLVWFFSDNGGARNLASNKPLRGHKGTDWEGGHRVAGIAYWPGHIEPGTVTGETAITLDVMPTVLALAGASDTISKDRPLDGIDISPLLLESKPLPPRPLFWNGRAIRDGDWKLISDGGKYQLFNLREDLSETTDLADRHPDRVEAMKKTLARWSEDVAQGATPQLEKPAE